MVYGVSVCMCGGGVCTVCVWRVRWYVCVWWMRGENNSNFSGRKGCLLRLGKRRCQCARRAHRVRRYTCRFTSLSPRRAVATASSPSPAGAGTLGASADHDRLRPQQEQHGSHGLSLPPTRSRRSLGPCPRPGRDSEDRGIGIGSPVGASRLVGVPEVRTGLEPLEVT